MPTSEQLKEEFARLKVVYGINLIDKIHDLRKYEIDNLWKRTLFFWGTIVIVFVAYFKSGTPDKYSVLISLVGSIYTIIFSLSVRGSKYWQEHWESIAILYENALNFNLFKTHASGLIYSNNKSWLTRPYRFSVSKLTMLLSDITAIVWLMFWIKDIYYLISEKFLKFDFGNVNREIDVFTISIVLVHFILLGYCIWFVLKGGVYHKFQKKQLGQV